MPQEMCQNLRLWERTSTHEGERQHTLQMPRQAAPVYVGKILGSCRQAVPLMAGSQIWNLHRTPKTTHSWRGDKMRSSVFSWVDSVLSLRHTLVS